MREKRISVGLKRAVLRGLLCTAVGLAAGFLLGHKVGADFGEMSGRLMCLGSQVQRLETAHD